ncbi:MAG: hypothetical protein AAFU85_16005 [Planctomycetota bacterium]
MSGRRRHTLAPSLFPFLAVLVCTLGTLILLLAQVAQNAAKAAKEIQELPPEDLLFESTGAELTVGEVNELIEEEQFRVEQLVSFREAQTNDLEERRGKLAHLDDHTRRLREELKQISDAMEHALSDKLPDAPTDSELLVLEMQLSEKQKLVTKLRETANSDTPRVVIVPHQGPNGTTRRPIYLECNAKGVTIRPENVTITIEQLRQSDRGANPLDNALGAIRYHAMQTLGDQTPPYPMLVVRPDGIRSYYAARGAMKDWDDQFGYELVPSDIELAYQNPDSELRSRIEYAIREATDRQVNQSYARALLGGGGGGAVAAIGNGNGVGGAGRGDRVSRPPFASEGNATNTRQPQSQALPPPLSVSEMDRNGRQSGFRDHRSFPSSPWGNTGSGLSESMTPQAAKERLERESAKAVEELADRDSRSPEGESDGMGQGENDPFAEGPGANAADDVATQGQPPQAASSFDLPDQLPPAQAGVGGTQAMAAGQPSQQSKSMANSHRISSQPQQVPGAASEQTRLENDAAPPPNAQVMPTLSADLTPRKKLSRNGADWALPPALSRHGNDVVRSVRVGVYADRFVILDRYGNVHDTFWIRGNDVDTATLELAAAVQDRIAQWGAALPGGRWAPRLKIDVAPGAQTRAQQLGRLMSGSGLGLELNQPRQADSQRGSTR